MMINPSAAAAAAAAAAVAAQINAAIAAQQRMLAPKIYFEEDVDINHSKTKHILTKGSTHNQIHALTGAVVTARGRYKALGDCSNNDPLHLHVSADSEDKLRAAVERIHKIMGPNPLKAHMASGICTVGFEPTPGFDALAEIQGPEGEFLNHIKIETSIEEILIRGRGALPPHDESSEPLHVYIGALNASAVNAAMELVENLLETVRTKYQQFCAQRDACAPSFNQGVNSFPGYSPALPFCPPPTYPPPEACSDMGYSANANQYAGMPPAYLGGQGWGENNAAGWAQVGRPSGWAQPGGFGGWGDTGRRNFGVRNGGWGGGGLGAGRGKASYNSVGPPPSIAYEHQKVMAEESVAAPPPSGSFGDSDRNDYKKNDGTGDGAGDRRRSFREEAGGSEPGPEPRSESRERRSFREEAADNGLQAGSAVRRSFREEASAADSPRPSFKEDVREPQRRAAEEPQERADGAPRKRRFVELGADEAAKPKADQAAAAAGAPEAATGRAPRLQPEGKVGKAAPDSKPAPRKLPPVPTFSAPKPPGPGGPGARADAGVMAAGTGAAGQKSSDAISLLLNEYDDADD